MARADGLSRLDRRAPSDSAQDAAVATPPRRHAGTLRLLLLLTLEASFVVALVKLGSVSRWSVDWRHFGTWLESTPLEDAVVALLRWVALGLASWLLASSLLYALARLTRVPALIRGTRWMTLPVIRSMVDKALVVTLAASTVVSARTASAWAHPVGAGTTAPPAAATVTSPQARPGTGQAHLAPGPPPLPVAPNRTEAAQPPPMTDPRGSGAVQLAPAIESEVRRGDNLWTLAATRLASAVGRPGEQLPARDVAPYWRSVVDANRTRLRSGHPSLIYAGERVILPAVMAPASASPPMPTATPPPSVPAAPSTDQAASAPAPGQPAATPTTTVAAEPAAPRSAPTSRAAPSHAERGGRDSPGLNLGPLVSRAAALAALGVPIGAVGGIVLKLNRLRRAQMARRRPGRDIPRPSPDLEPVERRLRAVAAEDAAEWLDAALRFLVAALFGDERLVPTFTCIRAGDFGLELLLSSPMPEAPPGFESADGGHVWRLDGRIGLEELVRRGGEHPPATPALVSLGNSPEGPVLADLEALGAVSVEGDPARVRAFLGGVALELATAAWAQGVDLRLVGDVAQLEGLEGVSRVEDAQALADEVEKMGASTADALGSRPSTLAARADPSSGDDWPPTVVVAGAVAGHTALDRLARAGSAGAGIAVVAAGPVEAPWRLVVGDDGAAVLEPLGLRVHVAGVAEPVTVDQAGLDEAATTDAAALLAVASQDNDVAPVIELDAQATRPPPVPRHHFDVWVAVLGPVEVTGWAEPPGRRKKLIELVAYLATHQHALTADELRTHCWPKDDITYKTFKQTISRVRRHLGCDSQGRRHLPEAAEGAYRLGPGVGCDWVQFQSLVATAERASDDKSISLYREALSLVRGEPFAHVSPGTYTWAWSDLLVHSMERAIADAAHHLAERALAAGDAETASWAARQALLATPAQLSLFETEMRAAAARRDVDGVKRGYQALIRAHHDVDPLADIPSESVALYQHLMAELGAGQNGRRPQRREV